MSFKSSLQLDSPIFDKAKRSGAIRRVVRQSAKEFKNSLRGKMINSPHTGKVYRRRSGNGFSRGHQASRRGERPAPETFNLANSITDKFINDFEATVEVTAKSKDGFDYPEHLQDEMGREIMTEADVEEADRAFQKKANEAIRNLLS